MSRTLKELIDTFDVQKDFDSLMEYLNKTYSDDIHSEAKFKDRYFSMIEKLKAMEPTHNCDLRILVVKQDDYLFGEEYMDVLGKTPGDPERYAMDFTPWSDWLGCPVVEKSVRTFGPVVFLAEVLHEMSFISFDEKNIKAEKEYLVAMADDVKNGNIEGIPAEQVFAELREKYGFEETEAEEEKESDEERSVRISTCFKKNIAAIDDMFSEEI